MTWPDALTASPGALSGVRVLGLSRVLSGPFVTMALADLVADVIKVEAPDGGDDTRQWGPPFQGDQAVGVPRARDLLFTGRPIEADVADHWGLASRVADDDAFDECVSQLLDCVTARLRDCSAAGRSDRGQAEYRPAP